MVDFGGVAWTGEGTIHDVFAFGTVLAADVLDDADVAAFDDGFDGVVVAVEDGAEVGAFGVGGEGFGVVGGAGEEDGGAAGVFRGEDDGVEFDAVAHGDHFCAAGVVEGFRFGGEGGRGFVGLGG